MRKLTLFGCLILWIFNASGQINRNDSTVQVVGYWDHHEKQTYHVSQEKLKIKDADTTSREMFKYVVDIKIADSTATSYTIDWFYHDYDIQTKNEIEKKLLSLVEDMTVTIKTDELGTFNEVVNWKDIRDYIFKAADLLKKETKEIPNMDKIITQIKEMYSTKESIEAAAINEIQQFYSFHGGKYKLGQENTVDIQLPNLMGGKPFDGKVTSWLDEINPDDNNSVLRTTQVVDSEQLTKTTFDYLSKMAETMQTTVPKWEEFPSLKNEVRVASRVHGSGWIIYSVQTKEVTAEGYTHIDETIIEIQ